MTSQYQQPGYWGISQWGKDYWQIESEGLQLGIHRFRLLIRWYDQEDLFPTYRTLLNREASYLTVQGAYATYQDLLDNIGGGFEIDTDLTCDLAGLRATAGRSSVTEAIRASDMNFTLVDRDGSHDPRVLPVASRSRIGARLRLEVRLQDLGPWVPVMTTWVESWRKGLSPDEDPQVDVQSSDAMNMLARAKPNDIPGPVGAGESTRARVQRILDAVPWNDKWGELDLDPTGQQTVNPVKWDGAITALEHLQDIDIVEDALSYFEADGTFRWENGAWRSTRTNVLGIDLIPHDADAPDWVQTPDAVVCPYQLDADDNDLNLVNKATVWRSTEHDAPVGDPPQQPDPVKRVASDSDSISWYGESAVTLNDLPAWSNTRTQQIADAWVARYAAGAQDIGEAMFDLLTHPEDAGPILNLRWGDTVVVRDKIGTAGFHQSIHEVVGVRHDITPYRWEATVILDRKVT